MSELERHCSVLGLSGTISYRNLQSAYRKRMLEWHPDLHQGDPERERVANAKAITINQAFEYLSTLLERSDPIILSARFVSRVAPRTPVSPKPRPSRQQSTQGFPDPSVFEVFVRSSYIYSIGYNRSTQILYIKFYRKEAMRFDIYRYLEVPEAVFRNFLEAESKGRFANRFIYPRYRYEPC